LNAAIHNCIKNTADIKHETNINDVSLRLGGATLFKYNIILVALILKI